ncbi:MAG: hypothetical protein K2X77_21040 [Candidatus Obscuribacterales bacterium]|nr:hypothetical protein [Candidatus Obscuribacterales bacterium]
MDDDEHFNVTVGENVTEVCHLLELTCDLIERDQIGTARQRESIKQLFDASLATFDESILQDIKKKLPHACFPRLSKYSEMEELTVRSSEEPTEPLQHLSFPDKLVAISIRQAVFNVISLLDRSCALFEHSGSSVEEKNLYKLRIAQILGGPLDEIMTDLFVAHPELAILDWKTDYDWDEIGQSRMD